MSFHEKFGYELRFIPQSMYVNKFFYKTSINEFDPKKYLGKSIVYKIETENEKCN